MHRCVWPWLLMCGLAIGAPASAGERVRVKGELVDTWCSLTGIMFAYGTAHHQCAVWCAIGGIPVSIKDKQGNFYMILRLEEDDTSVANPKIATIQTHEVEVDGELLERDGVNYLLVTAIADDHGIVNLSHETMPIQPFGH